MCILVQFQASGNDAYQAGQYSEAVEFYTYALACTIESRPFAALCFCNRAAAYQGLGQITEAIADCSLAIAFNANYIKVFSFLCIYIVFMDFDFYLQSDNSLKMFPDIIIHQKVSNS